MIECAGRLLAALTAAGVIDNPAELADALWLSQYLPADASAVATPPAVLPPEQPPPPPPEPHDSRGNVSTEPERKPAAPGTTPSRLSVHLPTMGQGAAIGGGRGIVAPAARALPDARAILRALRPLMRKVAVRGRWEIDEERTVDRVVEERIWLPVVRPIRERWLRLSLVVDGGVSMGIWRAAVRELYRLLQGCGAFLQVRLWSLDLAHDPPRLHPGLTIKPGHAGHDLRELHDPSGRTLLLLLSDAVGPEWYTSRTSAVLAEWARRMPVALLQMLPENLWPRTALSVRSEAYVHPTAAAVPSAKLRVERESDWLSDEKPGGVPLPLLVLEADAVSSWARLIAGRSDARLPGVLLDPGSEEASGAEGFTFRETQADERIEHFKRTASRSAWKLAGLLAVAPVLSLPILRLIRQEMVPEARQVHEAEVLLGGLLVLRGERAADPDEEQYEFHVGVRERLLDGVPVGQTLAVLERVADYVEKHLGMGFGLRALLRDPAASTGAFVPDDTSFAQVTAGVLERLGGHYARIVRPETPEVPAPIPVTEQTVAEPAGPAHWIWVMGTRIDPSDLERLAATQVARILVEEGYGLIVSGSSGLMQLVAQLFVEYQHEADEPEQPVTPPGGTLIQAEITRAAREGTYCFEAWLLSTRKHTLRSGEKAFSINELREEVRELCAELDRLYLSKHSLTMELFAPSEVIALEPAAWPVAGEMFGDVPLGTKYRVVVRDINRRGPGSRTVKPIWLKRVLIRGEEPILSSSDMRLVDSEAEKLAFCAREASAVIIIGGTHAAYAVAEVAQAAAKPIVPWAVTGEAAAYLHMLAVARWDTHPIASLKRAEFDRLTEPVSDGSVIRYLLRRLLHSATPEQRKPRAWVLVAGTGHEELSKPLSPVCRLVARILAEEGFGLITGGWVGVDTRVSLEFAHTLSEQKGTALEEFLCQVMYEDQPVQHELGRTIRVQGETEWQQTLIEKADAVVIIGGLGMTQYIAWAAIHEGKPVLPLAQTGGDARTLFDEVLRNWETISYPILKKAEFEQLERLSEDGSELRSLLNHVTVPGTEPPTTPPEVSESPMVWVSVAGTAIRDLPSEQLEASRTVGRILAEEGYGLLTGGCVGVDSAVARAFTETLDRRGVQGTLRRQRQVLTTSQPLEHYLGEIIRVPTVQEQNETALELASAFILIGDAGPITEETAEHARQAGKPVLPLAAAGGGAKYVHAVILDTWARWPIRSLTIQDFEELASPLGDGSKLRRLLHRTLYPHDEPVAQVESTRWVLVAGTARESLPLPVQQECARVGRLLAEAGCSLITGGSIGVDLLVGQAFVAACLQRGTGQERTAFRQYLVPGQARTLDAGEIEIFDADGFEGQLVQRADAVILIAGRSGTRRIAEAAVKAGKPVLPLASTGAYAEMLHGEILDLWEDLKVEPFTREEFARLADPLDAEIIRLLHLALGRPRVEATNAGVTEWPDVFISCSTTDDVCAREIAEFLTSSGVSVWLAQKQRTAGTSWPEEIVRAVQRCKVVLVLCSDAAIQSSVVRQEVSFATRDGKVLLPLIVSETKNLADLAYYLGHLQPLRLVGRSAAEWLPEVLAALEKAGVKQQLRRNDSLDLGNGIRMEFGWIPLGTFWMGGGGGISGDKQLKIEQGFGLGIYPVTQEQWQSVMGSNPSYFSRTGGGKARVQDIADTDLWLFPVEQVSWDDIAQFLTKLNEREKGSGWFYRLPTEAEWEYACRGGATSREDCSFHFYFDKPTNDLSSEEANFNGNSPEGAAGKGPNLERTSRVGSYRPNRLGLYDMHGNVWEWSGDLIDRWLDRVIRGGCWSREGSDCRATSRGGSAPSNRDFDLGFRVARVVP